MLQPVITIEYDTEADVFIATGQNPDFAVEAESVMGICAKIAAVIQDLDEDVKDWCSHG